MVALGGTGYAAIKLPKNSVGFKKNAVTGAKIENGSLLAGTSKRASSRRARRAIDAGRRPTAVRQVPIGLAANAQVNIITAVLPPTSRP